MTTLMEKDLPLLAPLPAPHLPRPRLTVTATPLEVGLEDVAGDTVVPGDRAVPGDAAAPDLLLVAEAGGAR